MNDIPAGLATLATSGAALLVLLIYAPALQAQFLVPKFAALELTAALGFAAFALRRVTAGGPRWTRPVTIGAWLVVATTAIAWFAAAARPHGAPYAFDAIARWGCVFGLACGVSVLDDPSAPGAAEARQRLLTAIVVAAAAVATVGLLQHLEILPFAIPVISKPGSTFGNRNAAAEVMALVLPLALAAAARAPKPAARAVILGAIALEFTFLAVTRTRGSWLGATCGVGATLLLARPRWSPASILGALGIAALVVVAATVPVRFNPRDAGDSKRYTPVVNVLEEGFDSHSTALRTRFGLWRRTIAMVEDHWLLGVGPGNWPVEFPRYAEPGATDDGVLSATLAPRQAHDDVLERTAEDGVPGLLALGVLAFGATSAIRRRVREGGDARLTAAGVAGALVALVVLSVASFPLEAPGTLALTGLSLGLVVADAAHAPRYPRAKGQAYVVSLASVALLAAVAWRAERNVRASRWLGRAEHILRTSSGPEARRAVLDALAHSLEAMPRSYRAELRTAETLLLDQRPAEAAVAAKRALELEPNGANAWAALAGAELAAGDPGAASRDASQALTILQDYPYALDVRARAAQQGGHEEASAADRLRLHALAAGTGDTALAARFFVNSAN